MPAASSRSIGGTQPADARRHRPDEAHEGRDGGKGTDDKRRKHPAIFIVPKQHELDGDARQSEQQEREQQPTQNVRRVIAHCDTSAMLANAALTAYYSRPVQNRSVRLLLVEDEPLTDPDARQRPARTRLRRRCRAQRTRGRQQAADNEYDLVILDLGLPDVDGLELCRQLRDAGMTAPILILTARDAVGSRIAGLDNGADDYLLKPFDLGELLARLRALVRRGARPPLAEKLRVGALVLDTRAQQAFCHDGALPLTTREYALLEYMARHAGRVITRADIAERVWDSSYDPLSNVIDVYVSRLADQAGGERRPAASSGRGAAPVTCCRAGDAVD